MKYADKISAKYSVVIGDDDLKNNTVRVKDMRNKENSFDAPLDEEAFLEVFTDKADLDGFSADLENIKKLLESLSEGSSDE